MPHPHHPPLAHILRSQFLRYGNRLDQSWSFEKWSVMTRFSYWKAKDVWLTGETSIAELGKDAIRTIRGLGYKFI